MERERHEADLKIAQELVNELRAGHRPGEQLSEVEWQVIADALEFFVDRAA